VSSYLVLARKYRPKQFTDMVGQESVVRTLVNAIQMGRTHQAYVFSGSRGIGKTSIARIFSKALRCAQAKLVDGILISCDQCSDCLEIAAGNSVNVLEIDGASNNGVDSVREIRENVKFLPSSGKYKIYIIDEVHMLTTAAFNALLKTLEEPPEHVVFIFATTESHKIPETILGRCQRFDFKRVTVAQITGRIKEVLVSEKIEAEYAAINLIARSAEGSMRDALSILDQVISFSGANVGVKIKAQAVRDSVGLIGTELVLAILKQVLECKTQEALMSLQQAFHQGTDLKVLLKSLQEMLHAVILFQVGVENPDTHFNSDELKLISELKVLRTLEENEMIFQVFHHGLDLVAKASQPKLIFDLLLIKAAAGERLEFASDTDLNAPTNPRRLDRRPEAVELTENEDVEEIVLQPTPQPAPPLQPLPIAVPEPVPVAKNKLTGEGFVAHVYASKPMLGLILESVVEWTLPNQPSPGSMPKLIMGFRERDQVKSEQVMQKSFKEQIAQMCESYFGMRATPEAVVSNFAGESVAERMTRVQGESRKQNLDRIDAMPVIQEAKSLFGATLTHIELFDSDGKSP
jgi:DNA polymerase-3 subunit gamma/tau